MPNAIEIIRNRNRPSAFYVGGETPSIKSEEPAIEPTAPTAQGFQPPPVDSSMQGYVPPEQPDEQSFNVPETAPQYTTPAYNPNATTETEARNEAIKTSITAPILAQIEANRKKQDVLRTMPVTDKDGRTKSGLQAFLQSLANDGQLRNARSWGDVAKAGIHSGGQGIGGAIDSTWNERQKRDIEINKYDKENERLQKQAEMQLRLAAGESSIANRESTMANRERNANRLDKSLDERVNQNKFNKLEKEKVDFLKPIISRGYFYEADATDAEKAEMQRLNITLPDFDKTRPAYNDKGGIRKAWDVKTRSYLQVAGDVEDDQIPVEIDGVRLNLTPPQFANYKATENKTNYETSLRQADNDQEYNKAVQDWGDKEEKRNQDNTKFVNDSLSKNNEAYAQEELANQYETEANSLAEDNPTKAAEMREKAKQTKSNVQKLRSEASSLMNQAQNSKPFPKPVKQAKLPTYTGAVQTQKFTENEIRARIKAQNPNATEDDFQKGIQKVKEAKAFKDK